METWIKGTIVVIAIAVTSIAGIFAYNSGIFGARNPSAGCPTGQIYSNGSCVTPAASNTYQTSLTYTDELAQTACTCTGVTNKNLYHTNGVWPVTSPSQLVGTAATALSTTLTTISLYPADNGFLGLWADSGITTDYVIPAATKATNPSGLVTDFSVLSIDNSGNLEVLFKVNFASVPSQGNGQNGPAVPITIRTASDDDSNLAIAATPPTQTSIGTGTKTVTITWYLGYASNGNLANNKAYTVGRIIIGSNETTFESLTAVTNVAISYTGVDPYIGTVSITASGNNIFHNTGAKQWEIIIGPPLCAENLGSAAVPSGCIWPPSNANVNYRQTFTNILFGHRQGDPGQISITVTFQTYFTSTGTGFAPTLKVDAAKPNNVLITQLTNAGAFRS